MTYQPKEVRVVLGEAIAGGKKGAKAGAKATSGLKNSKSAEGHKTP